MNAEQSAAWFVENIFVHDAGLRSLFGKLGASPSDIADLCQETYLRIFAGRATFPIQKPRAYLFEVGRNLLLDQRRRGRVLRIELNEAIASNPLFRCEIDPERRAISEGELAQFNAAVATLPTRCRQVYWLRHVERLTAKQVSRHLGIAPPSCLPRLGTSSSIAHVEAGLCRSISYRMWIR